MMSVCIRSDLEVIAGGWCSASSSFYYKCTLQCTIARLSALNDHIQYIEEKQTTASAELAKTLNTLKEEQREPEKQQPEQINDVISKKLSQLDEKLVELNETQTTTSAELNPLSESLRGPPYKLARASRPATRPVLSRQMCAVRPPPPAPPRLSV